MDNYQTFIHRSRYARWMPELGRRETWGETVDRYIGFFVNRLDLDPESPMVTELRQGIYDQDVMPSMRAMMCAGTALERDNVAGFNCSYIAIDHVRTFDELMYILMCGTGVGFSVERQYISKLPEVAESLHPTDTTIVVSDSKIGWASAFRELIAMLYAGKIPSWDTSRVRPAGAPLKVFGGRASGPAPLIDLFNFTVKTFAGAHGRKLTSLECHDLVCKVADIVVVGGVRRSALISLSNLSDQRLRGAKMGQWWENDGHRALANNSVSYTEKPDFESFLTEWKSLYDSKAGERGVFNRAAAQRQAEKNGRRDASFEFGTNPCSEIILRPNQFCNLSEVVVRNGDTIADLERKVRLATILGTMQSSLVDFRYLRSVWKKNTEEECLLGVSMTGIMDHAIMSGQHSINELPAMLDNLREVSIETNKEYAEQFGLNTSTAITCVKPSGTVSQLVDSASGIHPRFADHYIRTVRADRKDPLAVLMEEMGFPCEEDVMKPTNLVFSFPVKAPDGSITVKDTTAMEQLKLWKIYQDHWCEHKPSITVYYSDDEFMEIGAWLWKNFDNVSGISFLPKSDHVYQQAPYQDITAEQYDELVAKMPEIDWDTLVLDETEDNTEGSQTLACSGGVCEIVDLT